MLDASCPMGNSRAHVRMATAKKTWSRALKGLGARARHARTRAEFGLREAAEAIGIANSSLSRLEEGGRLVDLDSLILLAELYDVPLDWLLANRGPLPPRRDNGRPRPIGDRRRRVVIDET